MCQNIELSFVHVLFSVSRTMNAVWSTMCANASMFGIVSTCC